MPSLTDWLQASFAFGTCWLAWTTYAANLKIKTLTDVVEEMVKQTNALSTQVDEMSKQTKLMEQQYLFDSRLRLPERMPYFAVVSFRPFLDETKYKFWEIRFSNRGTTASNVKLSDFTSGFVGRWVDTTSNLVQTFSDFAVKLFLKDESEGCPPFFITLKYMDDRRNRFQQRIYFDGDEFHLKAAEFQPDLEIDSFDP